MYLPSVLLPVKRIIAIGDIHGDYKATVLALKKAKVIDSNKNWIGGTTVVVQLGDQIDRGGRVDLDKTEDEDSEFKIMNLLDKLHKKAKKQGGAVYSLIGNHEVMNVMGDYTYTSDMGIKHFGSRKQRQEYFKPGGKIAKKMAKKRNAILRIGDWIFVHAGIPSKIAQKYKIVEINNLMRNYLSGNKKLEKNKAFQELFLNNNSILWTRRFSEDKIDCSDLKKSLKSLGAKHMVIGHTPQENINNKCNGAIWRIDTGMSRAFGKRMGSERIQILEILNNGEKVNII